VARCSPAGPAAPTDAYRRRIHHRQRLLACLSLPGQRAVTPHASRADAKLNIRFQLFDRAKPAQSAAAYCVFASRL
jgi:hypothetical protein